MRSILLALLSMACSGSPEPTLAPLPAPAPAPVAAPVAAPAPAAGPVLAGDAEAGAAVYAANCAACHQADGTGLNGMLAADFTKEEERLAKSDAELLGSIREGITSKRGTMPAWKTVLTEQQMADALAYVRKSFGKS